MTKEQLTYFLQPFMDDAEIYLEFNGRKLFLDELKYVPATYEHNAHITISLGAVEYQQMLNGHYSDK